MTDRQLLLEEIKQYFDQGLPFSEEQRIAAESDPGIAALLAELDQLNEDFSDEAVYRELAPAGLHAGIMSAIANAQSHGFLSAHGRVKTSHSRWVVGLLPLAALFAVVVLYQQLHQQTPPAQTILSETQETLISLPLPTLCLDPVLREQRLKMEQRGRNVTSAAEGFLRVSSGLIPTLSFKEAEQPQTESNPS